MVIGNPPYIKEYTDKSVFNGLRKSPYYQGKMDLWYLFTCSGLDILKENGSLCFIAPNNWTTNSGASKMRNKIIEDAKITKMLDFGSYMIFESADIQTMVMLISKTKSNLEYKFDLRKIKAEKAQIENVLELIENSKSINNDFLSPTILKELWINKTLTFSSNEKDSILEKIKNKENFNLDEKKEVAQGIVPNPDIVSKKALNLFNVNKQGKTSINVGDGVFVIDDKTEGFENFEIQYLKPLFEPFQLVKFIVPQYSVKKLIYITKKNYRNNAENILKHLAKYKEIMVERRENKTGQINFYHLHWPRNEYFFEKGAKILCVRKCVSEPIFSYTEDEAYVMMSINVIKTDKINQKYLTAFLNSKLIAFWLKNKGKMQGNNYQLDKEPLLQIPIFKPEEKVQEPIIFLVNEILNKKKEGIDTSELENEIDKLVYDLYGLNNDEIRIIEK